MTTPFPFGLPDSTPDPETQYTGPEKTVFPGARPAAVTRDPEHEGDTNTRKTTALPFGLPFGTSVTSSRGRDGDPSQANNANFGGGFGESGVSGAMGHAAVDPEGVQGSRTYTDPEPLPAGQAGVNTPEQAGRSGQKNADYLPPSVADDPTHAQPEDANLKPAAPTSVTATAGVKQASVAFTAPASGPKPTQYIVTSAPGGITATGASSPIVVTGLTTGTAYTFTVVADSENGQGAASAASSSVTPT